MPVFSHKQPVMSKIVILILLLCILLLVPRTFPLSFDMNPITDSSTTLFNLSGDAYIDDQGIQITTNDLAWGNRLGRATLKEPVYLWDEATGNLSDFSSNFSFIINYNGSDSSAGGLAFFLAPLDSTLKPWCGGKCFGLGDVSSSSNSSDSFVAVKFDTYLNKPDPFYSNISTFPAVCININNMTSINASSWYDNVAQGFTNDAWINYDSVSKMLTVEFTYVTDDDTVQRSNLSYEVDLREYLPEYVMVGFSASTGEVFDQNLIQSWSFSSTLQPPPPPPSPAPTPPPTLRMPPPSPTTTPPPPVIVRRKKKGLIYGLSVGLSIVILATAFAIFVVWKKKKMCEIFVARKKKKMYEGSEEDLVKDSSMANQLEEKHIYEGSKEQDSFKNSSMDNQLGEKMYEGSKQEDHFKYSSMDNELGENKKMYEGSKEEDRSSDSSMDKELGEGTGPRKFSYNELVAATDNFAEERKLGKGGFGCVYKGILTSTNTHIAVKRVSEGSEQGRKEYVAEVKIISQLRHRNLVQLIGWCHQRSELLLVYEFMPNRSLDFHIFNKFNSIVITWEMRYRIAQGLASSLLYLHEELRQCVLHRDIKASNIMLDNDFNAKLGDFGLARLVDHDKDSKTTIVAGTFGYMAPEYPTTGRASKETDIYSFGIVLLEIACGRRPIDYNFPRNQIVLVEWVWSLYGGGKLLDGADPKLESSEDDVDKIELLMIVGLWCVHPDSRQRPSIRQAVNVLYRESPLPVLALSMPKATYDSPVHAMSGSSSNAKSSTILSTSSAGSGSDLLPKSG